MCPKRRAKRDISRAITTRSRDNIKTQTHRQHKETMSSSTRRQQPDTKTPRRPFQQIHANDQLSSSPPVMVTYSRKRKHIDFEEPYTPVSGQKLTIVVLVHPLKNGPSYHVSLSFQNPNRLKRPYRHSSNPHHNNSSLHRQPRPHPCRHRPENPNKVSPGNQSHHPQNPQNNSHQSK